MAFEAKIILDSINEFGNRLTTFVVKYPRFVLAEVNTHRALSRNSASSRAIPVSKFIQQVIDDPAMPVFWGKNKPGMQASEELSPEDIEVAKEVWLEGRDRAVNIAKKLLVCGAHKQITNRVLEPWMWTTTIISATDLNNFYDLRRHVEAQPEIKRAADLMFEAQLLSSPTFMPHAEWHLPFVTPEERKALSLDQQKKVSVARCARVSYLNHDGTEPNIEKDIQLHERLFSSGHFSPFEHVATPSPGRWANFNGFRQYRNFLGA